MSVEEEVECIEYCVENTEEFLKQMINAADILAYYCVTNQCRLLKYHCFSVVNCLLHNHGANFYVQSMIDAVDAMAQLLSV